MQKDKLHIVIVAAADYPEGSGESTRLKTMASALRSVGNEVQIILENTSGNVDERLLQVQGEVDGVPFRYILGNVSPIKGLNFIISKFKAVKLILNEIMRLYKQGKVDVIWLNQLAFHDIYPITRLCKKLGIKIVHSYEDERVKRPGFFAKLIYFNQVLADKYLARKADAIVAISYYLRDKYAALTRGKVPISIIPTIVNVNEWDVGIEPENTVPIILYYGGFYGFDEVEKMIMAIKILKDRGERVKFYLVGYNRRRADYMEQIADLVKQCDLINEIDLKGFTPRSKLKDYLREANILLGLRSSDEWSSTGLSTKLSEYLATGRMVICTDVGDNLKYLTDGKSARVLSANCTNEELADAISRALANPKERMQIGLEGQNVALNEFDSKFVSAKIRKMLERIK